MPPTRYAGETCDSVQYTTRLETPAMLMALPSPDANSNNKELHAMETQPIDDSSDSECANEEEEEESGDDDRDDKSWRTRGESSPTASSAALGTPRAVLLDVAPYSYEPDSASAVPRSRERLQRRQLFWRNIVRQYNFENQESEREKLLSLTRGIDWMHMACLPRAFMARHKEIYYLICRADYDRSSTIQRDVTRTFSIFERSQLPSQERDVNAQQRALFRVLNAVAEAEDGYCQGMNFIAALFLVEGLDEADAYALFLYLLKKRQLARIYQHSSTFLDDYLHHFERMFQKELPDLYQHLHAQGFAIPMYGIEWFTTLFSLSTKPELACAIFDLFFVGVQDIFLRIGLAILKLLEAPLMCMHFEDFLREFKPLVRQIDPYHAILQALAFAPNPVVAESEDTTAHIARLHYQRIASQAGKTSSSGQRAMPPRAYHCHRTLPPELVSAIQEGDVAQVVSLWLSLTALRPTPRHCLVLANEILHFAVWYGHVAIAMAAIRRFGADIDNGDETALTPLHFAVIRNQPDMVRLLLCCGADPLTPGGRWSGAVHGLSALETATHWKFCDTSAVRFVLEKDVCLCCNTKFDAFAFHRETCRQCKFLYCGRGDRPCIERHACPTRACVDKKRRTLRHPQSEQLETTSETRRRIPSTSPSEREIDEHLHRLDRTLSDSTSSSFVYIHSPTSDLPVDLSPGGTRIPSTTTTTTTSVLDSLVDWLGAFASPLLEPSDHDSNIEDPAVADVATGIEFPPHADWYCNARHCHVAFSFFSRGDECNNCRGLFCAADFDAQTSQCRQCASRTSSLP